MAAVAALLAWQAIGSWVPDATVEEGGTFPVDASRFAFYLLLLCTLISATLIEFDGHVPPLRMFWLPAGGGLLMLVLWPSLQPPAIWTAREGAWAAAEGAGTAVLLAAGSWLIAWRNEAGSVASATAAVVELVLVGEFLGAGAVVLIGAVAMMILFLAQWTAQRCDPAHLRADWASCLTVTTLVWLMLIDDSFARRTAWMAHPLAALLIAAGLMTAIALARRVISRWSESGTER